MLSFFCFYYKKKYLCYNLLKVIELRTKNSLKNIASVILFNLIVGILGFVKVRIFVNGLSNDIYSLHQLFYQIFSYIAIADIGFGLILNQKFYKAFAKNDLEEVNRIYSTSKKFYNIIGTAMLLIALIISFFVQFLTKANISPLYIQIVFIIFIIRNVVDYYFIAPRYVLEANQKLYKVNHLVRGIKILETLIEIILVLLRVNYLLILIPGIILTIIMDICINKKIYKEYPWLHNDKSFDKKYLKGTKDVIYQKVAGLLNSNTDIILISTFVNPISVIIYTSYSYITKFITDTIYTVSSAITPSYANVINKEEQEKGFSVFSELNIMFLFIASFVFIMFYGFLSSLINFWVGPQYVINNWVLLLFCIIAFQLIADRALIIIINSKGLFKETRVATVSEAIINLILSLILIHQLGIAGVLLGTITAKLVSSTMINSRYMYKHIFNNKPIKYYLLYFGIVAINTIFIIAFNLLSLEFKNIFYWILYVMLFSIVIFIALFIIYLILFTSFRKLVARGIEFIKVKGKYSE